VLGYQTKRCSSSNARNSKQAGLITLPVLFIDLLAIFSDYRCKLASRVIAIRSRCWIYLLNIRTVARTPNAPNIATIAATI